MRAMSKHRIQFFSALVALIFLTMPFPANAHTQLISENPTGNAILSVIPEAVELIFDDQLLDFGGGNKVSVKDPLGREITTGESLVLSSKLTRKLLEATEPGNYLVSYRVVSADGHVVEGSYSFSLQNKPSIANTLKPEISDSVASPTPLVAPATSDHANHSNENFFTHHKSHIYLTVGALSLIVGWWFYRRSRSDN